MKSEMNQSPQNIESYANTKGVTAINNLMMDGPEGLIVGSYVAPCIPPPGATINQLFIFHITPAE